MDDTRMWSNRIMGYIMGLAGAFYLYTAAVGQWGVTRQRGLLLTLCIVAVFLAANPTQKLGSRLSFIWDLFLALLAIAAFIPSFLYDYAMESRAITGPANYEIIAGAIYMLLLLEAARRSIGVPFVTIAIAALIFCRWGNMISDKISPQSGGWVSIVDYVLYSGYGIYGVALYVGATVVVVLVIFGALLQTAGGYTLFNDLPQTLFGTQRGGAAKVAVVGSSIMGMLSGSPTANVATVGVFTIPMMKNIGYSPIFSAAIETAASCGGQIMPPIMGAVAFIMADILQVSYWEVAVAAALPACLYYLCLFIQVDLRAAKIGLKGLPRDQLPPFGKTLVRALPMMIPIAALIYGLGIAKVTAQMAGLMAIAGVIIASWLQKGRRMTPKLFYLGLTSGMRVMVQIGIACAAAGVIIASIDLSGTGVTISSTLIEMARGNLLLLSFVVALASLILGTGLSTTPCYLLLAFVVAPALIKLGVPPMAAHLFILYHGCLSQLSPPEGLAGYTAAGIAGAPVFKTMWASMRVAAVGYIVPFFFIFNPHLLLMGSPLAVFHSVVVAIIGVIGLSIALEGYVLNKLSPIERVIAAGCGFALIAPTSVFVDIGCTIVLILIIFRKKIFKTFVAREAV